MSNQLCHQQLPNYEYTGLVAEPAPNNISQQQILEQLLLALTNQLAMHATQNTRNLSQHFPSVQSLFSSESNSNDRNNNNTEQINNSNVLHRPTSRANPNKMNHEFPQTTASDDSEEEATTSKVKKQKTTNDLINLESFNLDTHLDLQRYMYFKQNPQEINPEADLNVDCHQTLTPSCLLSSASSSSSSSNSSISNLCKAITTNNPTQESKAPDPMKVPVKRSSSDCLSGDEGYYGSYSDTKNVLNHNQQARSNSETISQQEHNILLKYLLQNQHITQLNNLESTNSVGNIVEGENGNSMYTTQIPCLNIFSSTQEHTDKFTSLLSNSIFTDDCDMSTTNSDQTKFDVINLLSTSEKSNLHLNHQYENNTPHLDSLKLKEEIIEILTNQQMQRNERDRLEEIEMRTINWRNLLDKRAKIAKHHRELSEEDRIDGNAYLNEIEMNIDHFQSCDSNRYVTDENEDVLIDTLLKFRTNRSAFNLRRYHQSIELEQLRRRLLKEDQENKIKLSLFANIHVDSIAEFTPYTNSTTEQYYDQFEDQQELIEQEYDNCLEQLEYDEMHGCQYVGGLENDYTMIDESNDVYDENGYLVGTSGADGILYEELESADLVDAATDSECPYEEDYEDYEDQVLVDSLSESDALTLLRDESEMYALQMSQASKSGLLPKAKTVKKKKSRFDSGTSSTTTQSTDTNASNVDIFENVFNFDATDSSSDLASSSASVSGVVTDTENAADGPEYIDLDINEFFMPQQCEQELGNGNISNSLRNSLLKMRHTRRHLAKLIESKNSSLSGGSSMSGSLTNLNTPMGSQFTKQITISALSRKPCVYMLNEGRCMRADCRFAHDLKQITCKYWTEGECLKGENCEFLHELIEDLTPPSSKLSKTKTTKPIIKKKDFKLDTDDFPTLGGMGGMMPSTTAAQATEYPLLAASPISILTAHSPKESSILKAKTPLTAASILKTTPAVSVSSLAVNIVPNKVQQQPKPTKTTNNLSQKQRKQHLNQSNDSPKSISKLATKHVAHSKLVVNKNNSCGSSSSASSSCSSMNGDVHLNSRGKKV